MYFVRVHLGVCAPAHTCILLPPDQRRAEWLDKLRRGDMARYESEVASRAKESTHTTMLMGLLEEWGLDNDARKAQRDRDAEAGMDVCACVCVLHVQTCRDVM